MCDDLLRMHQWILGFESVLALALLILYYRWFRIHNAKTKTQWQLYAYGGGAAIAIEVSTKKAAIEYCTKHHGSVTYVDETNRFVFYKPFAARG